MANFFLPLATEGRNAVFYEGFAGRSGQTTIITPQALDIIIVGSTTVSRIESPDVVANTDGSACIGLICITAGTWKVTSIVGTWILIP